MRAKLGKVAVVALVGLLAACSQSPAGGTMGTSSPSGTPTSSAASAVPSSSPTSTQLASASAPIPSLPVASVTSAAQAAAIVLGSDQKFASVVPNDMYLAGETAWYEAYEEGNGYTVSVTLGTGDCPAGCIHKHTWTFSVGSDGTIKLLSDEGDDVQPAPIGDGDEPATVQASLLSGPTCPVEHDPPDPSCAPRPVADTEVVVRAPSGAEAQHATSDERGGVTFSLPGGAYYVEPADAAGMMGQAEPVAFSVPAGGQVTLTFRYDTGIR